MHIQQLTITNWRNYDSASLELSSSINLIIGDNAQGKTNLLEAVYLCGVGRSARTPRDKELIRWQAEQATINAILKKRLIDTTIQIIIDQKAKKRVAINTIPLTKIGELMGECRCVLFSPDELKIIKDAPSERRRFIDIALCQLSKVYFYTLSDFTKILAQRNKLLKQNRNIVESLDIWDIQLAAAGAKIIKSRKGFIRELSTLAQTRHLYLTDQKEQLNIDYEGIKGETVDQIRENFLLELKKNRQKDLKNQNTSVGPHKDDICIAINDNSSHSPIDIRTYGSQGQQRTAALSLKLAEVDLFTKNSGESPILLLDDVLSELDTNRCQKLLTCTVGTQTIITATHIEKDLLQYLDKAKTFIITNGNITIE